jgi:hypothetical protein
LPGVFISLLGTARYIPDVSADTTAPSLYELLLGKLEQHPRLLAVTRENCARWLREGHSAPERLRQWDELLADAQQTENGRAQLRAVLRGETPELERLREFHPLAGILTREERRRARELCGFRH